MEVSIGAASGSLSRIESGKVIPSQKTISKIIEILDLTPIESARLYDVNTDYFAKFIKIANNLTKARDIDELIKSICEEIVEVLNLVGAGLYLLSGENITLNALSTNKISKVALSIIPFSILKVNIPLSRTDNIVVRSILERKPLITHKAFDTIVPVIPEVLANRAQKIAKVESFISIPIIKDDKTYGAIVYAKAFKDNFEDEIEILDAFTENIAYLIARLLKNS